jgi:polysaccharide pyruvyl transferase WcaK-like protein
MHATIAGLSSGVPTAAIAYSLKTLGVFETCGMGAHVADPMKDDTDTVVGRVVASFEGRGEARAALAARRDDVLARGRAQIDQVVESLRTLQGRSQVVR